MKINAALALAAALIPLAGCATGKQFSLANAQKVRVGMSTNELVKVMGQQPFTIAPVRANALGIVTTRPISPSDDEIFGYIDIGLERWLWWHTSIGMTAQHKEIASFIIGDGKVLQGPGPIATTEAEMKEQNRKATEELERIVQDRLAAQRAPAEQAKRDAAAEKRREFISAHPELKERVRQCVLDGKICIGMPAEALEISWGRPISRQKTTGRFGTTEIWRYGPEINAPLVFLDNDQVTGWHTSE